MTRRFIYVGLCVIAFSAAASADGAKLFALHCAACHGRDATGSGPMTEALKQIPPDLTQLAVQNGGTFPTAQVIAQIDGRQVPIAHGGPMPVYGWLFEGPKTQVLLPDGDTVTTTEEIAQIVSWLETR